jgi:hypothetical protein
LPGWSVFSSGLATEVKFSWLAGGSIFVWIFGFPQVFVLLLEVAILFLVDCVLKPLIWLVVLPFSHRRDSGLLYFVMVRWHTASLEKWEQKYS